jgi:hypothetical protein
MANIGQWAQKNMLDWVLGGATPTRPTTWWVGLSLGAPTSVSNSEIGAGFNYTRQGAATVFGAAATPAGLGSATNSLACTFGTFASSATISGLFVADASTSGNILWFGTLAAVRTPNVGDSLILAQGALVITLA